MVLGKLSTTIFNTTLKTRQKKTCHRFCIIPCKVLITFEIHLSK